VPIYDEISKKLVRLWLPVTDVESSALDQLKTLSEMPILAGPIAAMPDCHTGIGACVGTVVPLKDALIPSCVGVDIACGMGAMKLNIEASRIKKKSQKIREALESAIPVGFNKHNEAAWKNTSHVTAAKDLLDEYDQLAPEVVEHGKQDVASLQLGTLGGGNHFIELSEDSGSRNIGKELADAHIWRAKQLEHNKHVKDRNLSYFIKGTHEFDSYWHDLQWAQRYADLNRRIMSDIALEVTWNIFPSTEVLDAVWCHHNFVEREEHGGEEIYVTRKGAIRAGLGERAIIPGSMGSKSYIVVGKGEASSYRSASHGAGRKMSRSAAKKRFTKEDAEFQTKGIECRKDSGIFDELPGAYKDIDVVMERQADLVEPIVTLKQIICIKG
jgi:tRNA-splicing ligase RtcB